MGAPHRAAGHHLVCPIPLATDPRPRCGAHFVPTLRPASPRAVPAVGVRLFRSARGSFRRDSRQGTDLTRPDKEAE